ncbi:universal stress protein [bacterium CPR1]|nr:universal stress protein [bacterium CPR1]
MKFLIPLDGSPLAPAALQHAAGLAAHRSAELLLVHVVQEAYQGATMVAPYNDEQKRKGRVCLESAESLLEKEGYSVRTRMLTGEPGPALIQCAREENPDLIAMGTHGRGGLERLLLGSVTEHVLTCAPCPVLVTRQEEDELDLSAARAWPGYSRALVALDGSDRRQHGGARARSRSGREHRAGDCRWQAGARCHRACPGALPAAGSHGSGHGRPGPGRVHLGPLP